MKHHIRFLLTFNCIIVAILGSWVNFVYFAPTQALAFSSTTLTSNTLQIRETPPATVFHSPLLQHISLTNSPLRYRCPLKECKVITPFYIGAHNWDPGHRGVDLAATIGESIFAPDNATVIYAGKVNDRFVLSLKNSLGLHLTFEPIKTNLTKGMQVNKGQLIGTVEDGHCPETTCLHWGVKYPPTQYLNPIHLLSWRTIRLIE